MAITLGRRKAFHPMLMASRQHFLDSKSAKSLPVCATSMKATVGRPLAVVGGDDETARGIEHVRHLLGLEKGPIL